MSSYKSLTLLTCCVLVVSINAKSLINSHVPSTADIITFKDALEPQESSGVKRIIREDRPVWKSAGDSSKVKLPAIDNRVAIQVGSCPLGYERVGGFCVPSDYD